LRHPDVGIGQQRLGGLDVVVGQFVTGQMPTDPEDDRAPLPQGVEAQTRRVLENLRRVLAGAGSALDQVIFARVYLTEFERDYAAMNAVYQSYFAPGRLPARTCIGVTALARGALVEIDLLARRAPTDCPSGNGARIREKRSSRPGHADSRNSSRAAELP
jgi:2-iminobutanoate/2-iminopropanoate deaminase